MSVEASLQMHTKDIVLRMRMHCNIAYNALFSTVHYCYNGKQYVTVRMWLFYSYFLHKYALHRSQNNKNNICRFPAETGCLPCVLMQ